MHQLSQHCVLISEAPSAELLGERAVCVHCVLTNTLFYIHNTDILVNRKFVLILLLCIVKTYDVCFLSKFPPGALVLPEAAPFWQKFSSVQCQKK